MLLHSQLDAAAQKFLYYFNYIFIYKFKFFIEKIYIKI